MNFISLSIRIIKEQHDWLKKQKQKTGESINTIIRTAINEYKNRMK